MFRKIISAAALLLLPACSLYAQSDFSIRWDARPKIHTVPDSFSKQSAVFVLLQRQMEYRTEGKEVNVYRTIHHIIKPLDDRGLEAFNTFTIPIGSDREITSVMARTILPDGKVIEVGRDKVKRTKNEDGYEEYRIALEGVSKGAEVELLYTEKRPLALFGMEQLQFGLPVMRAEFELICPNTFHFQTKGYNGFPAARDTLIGKYWHFRCALNNIAGMEEEPYSYPDVYNKKLAYRLSTVEAAGRESPRQLTWDDLARELYKSYYTAGDKQRKVLDRYLNAIGVNDGMSDVQKIETIEEAMKTGISISSDLEGEEYEDLEHIIKSRITNAKGFVRLMVACLMESDVECELGLSSDRFSEPVDEHFELWNILDQYVLYFPRPKAYLAPLAINLRYPFIPASVRGNKAIFCPEDIGYKLGASFIASVRSIPLLPMESTQNNLDAVVRFKGEDLVPEIDITHSFSGYLATGLRDGFVFASRDKEKELVSGIIDLADKKEDILSYKVENAAFSGYNDNRPLKISAVVQSPQLLEKAGNKYLFKVGEVIGSQVEMYNDEHRSLPIDMGFSHSLERKIRVEIPQGYKVTNAAGVRLNVVQKNGEGQPVMGFVSDYAMEGSAMVITIHEFYQQSQLPVSDYPVFRQVINAAADFNKVILVMQQS